MKTTFIRKKLLAWYRLNARSLPWRDTGDAYAIWVSEVMLQQTRVETVVPYFTKWMHIFPDVSTLAEAPIDQVMKAWEGLGYYSRARNLHASAREIIKRFDGQIPKCAAILRKLPGIGDYIAGAIASIAFKQPEPALDGNGMRVLARLSNYQQPVNTSQGKRHLTRILRELLPQEEAGTFNQAIMDLGSGVCLTRQPRCDVCPINSECLAKKFSLQEKLPVKNKKKPIPLYQVAAAVMLRKKSVLIAKRRPEGLLGGLWEFPGGKLVEGETLQQALIREIKEELGVRIGVGEKIGEYTHAYTHYRVNVHAFYATIHSGSPQALAAECIKWVATGNLDDYPMGKVDRWISNDLMKILSD